MAMPYQNTQSLLTMDGVASNFAAGAGDLEQRINTIVEQLNNNPALSQGQVIAMQQLIAQYTALLTLESSIIKQYGDTLKSIAQNVGT
jgi:type III secretion apparatus needle protein